MAILHLCPHPLFGTQRDNSGRLLVRGGIHVKPLFPHKSDFSFESHFLRIEIDVAKYLGLVNISLRTQESKPLQFCITWLGLVGRPFLVDLSQTLVFVVD